MMRGGGGGGGAGGGGGGGAAAAAAAGGKKGGKGRLPSLEDFLSTGDLAGAVTLLEFNVRAEEADERTLPWLGYCAFHLRQWEKAGKVYGEWGAGRPSAEATLCIALCQYRAGRYAEAAALAGTLPDSPAKTRLLFHAANKAGDEATVKALHRKLSDRDKWDQLSFAALQFSRSHYSEAIDIYKKILLENRDDVALNVYIALCYYKLDYYDVSQEVLAVYLQSRPPSIVATNLKACNTFRLLNGKAAEGDLRALADAGVSSDASDLVRHNLVVFRNGDAALRVLPGLLTTVVPEARLNLVIYHLRAGAVADAYELVRDTSPALPPEYIVSAICHASLAQRPVPGLGNAPDHLRDAIQLFNIVGASASECDTIPGRQCMASCYFLQKAFEDVNVYLSSVKQYMYADDDFNWNYGLSLAATGAYKEAEEALLLVQSPAYTAEATYVSWLARCYIMNRKPRAAWELYLKTHTSAQSTQLLSVIANDCYKVGAFLYAAKAFDNLERLDDADPEHWEGKRGACIGVLQQVIAGTESKDALREVLVMLRNTSNPQVEYITRTIQRWAQTAGV